VRTPDRYGIRAVQIPSAGRTQISAYYRTLRAKNEMAIFNYTLTYFLGLRNERPAIGMFILLGRRLLKLPILDLTVYPEEMPFLVSRTPNKVSPTNCFFAYKQLEAQTYGRFTHPFRTGQQV